MNVLRPFLVPIASHFALASRRTAIPLAIIAIFAAGLSCQLIDKTVAEPLVGIASVVDGDTIEVEGVRIRLEGIDAPAHLNRTIANSRWGLSHRSFATFPDCQACSPALAATHRLLSRPSNQ